MFGFDNKVPDQTAAAPMDPTGAPALPADQPVIDTGYPGIAMTPGQASTTEDDNGADEGTMNDDAMPSQLQSSGEVSTTQPVSDNVADQTAEPVQSTYGVPAPVVSVPSTDLSHDDLLTIKQNALEQLSPLVGHLEQTPEEKFKTTMMMIQGSDDQSLVPAAYEAANAITDEKVKAQALLDIVNEINYFTQHHQN